MAKTRSGQRSAPSGEPTPLISMEERQRMIAEAAYFRAEARGFSGGSAVDDWLAAEREVNRMLPTPQQQKDELVIYEKLRAAVRKFLADTREAVSAETVRQAFDKAVEELRKAGEHTADTVGKVAASLRKDMADAAAKMGPRWEKFSDKSADAFDVWRDRGGLFLAQAASAVGEWLRHAGTKLGQQAYRAGEMVYGGTFECTGCGERVMLKTSGHLPPCAKCRGLEFRRV